jgi:hypothetical protein
MLSVVLLGPIYAGCHKKPLMLSVVVMNVVMLSVVAPCITRVSVNVNHFHPSLIFVGKVRSLPLERSAVIVAQGYVPALSANVRLGWLVT